MASSLMLQSSVSPYSSKSFRTQNPTLSHSQFLHSKSFLKFKRQSLLSNIQTRKLRTQKSRSLPVVYAVQSNFAKVLQTAWRVGKDGIEAGTNLVPDSVPRTVARISVAVVTLTISLFVLKSVLSTALFALGTMGLVYFIFIALNKDNNRSKKGGGDSSSTEDSLEEARRIMEKYK